MPETVLLCMVVKAHLLCTRSEAVGILTKRREALQFENSTQLLRPHFDLVSSACGGVACS